MEEGDEAQAMQGEKGWGNKNGQKGYKKGIIIFLFTHAMPGPSVSEQYKLECTKSQWPCYTREEASLIRMTIT